jgi:hypothetical protein
MRKILDFKKFSLNEATEFNYQRLNSDSVRASVHVDDPSLSINAFDKHEDIVRQAISKLGNLSRALQNTQGYKVIKSKLSLEDQQISNVKVIRIIKSSSFQYDVYLNFKIDEDEYWGVIIDILKNPEFKSEVFKDNLLLQTKEWIIKTKGLMIKAIRNWMKPQFGKFKLLEDEVICYSNLTGKLLRLPKNSIIEVLKSYNDKLIFSFDGLQYTLTGDNFVYFNWWFEEIKD